MDSISPKQLFESILKGRAEYARERNQADKLAGLLDCIEILNGREPTYLNKKQCMQVLEATVEQLKKGIPFSTYEELTKALRSLKL